MGSVLFLTTVIILSAVSTGAQGNERFFIDKHGDLILGGLFPIHLRGVNENECGHFQSMPGYLYLEAMLYAIDKINNDTAILPGVTLGARIYDSCHSQTIGAKMTKELITLTLVPPDSGAQLAGVIGPQSSDLSKVVADFLRVFKIPQISYGSTASVLGDKNIYSYFFRTVPPDSYQTRAMADIVLKLGWNYVITIHSNGIYGNNGMEEFHYVATMSGICIAQRHSLSSFPSEEEFDRLVMDLNNEQKAQGVILFTVQRDSRLILKALKRKRISKKFYWIASDSWGNNLNVVEGLEQWAEGAIIVSQLNIAVKGFNKYLKSLNATDSRVANDTWLKHFLESQFGCSLSASSPNHERSCFGNESLSNSNHDIAPVRTVVNAVYAMAHALHDYLKNRCQGKSGLCMAVRPLKRNELVEYLKNTKFHDQATGELLSFNKKQEVIESYTIYNFQKSGGIYLYKPVGIWEAPKNTNQSGVLRLNNSNLVWPDGGSKPPVSLCSETCSHGYVRTQKANHDIKCCWICVKCMPRNIIVNNTCQRCPFGYSPHEVKEECVKLPAVDVMSQTSSKVMLTVSVVGLVCVIIVAIIFFKHGHLPLIKASSRELSGIILLGLALLFMFPWLLLAEPSRATCACQPVLLGVALASCYAPLFMKILRIFRIFNSAKKSARKPILVSPASQVLIAMALIMIQLLFTTTSFFPTMPVPVERESTDGRELYHECSIEKDIFASLLSYNMLLMVLCTIVAFKTRKFPRNFNEAKYIGFTMYFTCFVWLIFFPFYLSSGDGLHRVNWECGAVLFIGWITLLGLFGPKIGLLFMGGQVANNDQLAVTASNTISQAAVVRVDNTETTMERVGEKVEEKVNTGTTSSC